MFIASRPLVWVTIGLLCGQAAAPHGGGTLVRGLIALLAILSLAGGRLRAGGSVSALPPCAAAPLRWASALEVNSSASLVAATLAAAAIGHAQLDAVLRPRLDDDHIAHFAGAAVEIEGRIAERPSRAVAKTRLVIDVSAVRRHGEWLPVTGRALVSVRTMTREWRRGDHVGAQLRLRRPRNFGNPGEFDYEAYLARRRIYVTSFATDDRSWRRQPGRPLPTVAMLERWRRRAATAIDETLAEPEAAIIAALLLGESAAVDTATRERYAKAGMSHVLAISGLHIGLVVAAAYGTSRWLLCRSEWLLLRASVPKLALAATVLPVLLYASMAGGNLATVRAVVMTLLVVAAVLLDRQRDWLTALAVAAGGASLWWPGSIFEISFQLSFAAVLAIILGLPRVTAWWDARQRERLARTDDAWQRLARWAVLYEAVTVCAMLGTAPLTAWHFNRLSFIGVVANALLVPLVGLIPVSLGLVAVVLLPFAPAPAEMLLKVTGVALHAGDRLVELAATIPGAATYVVTPSLLEIVVLYGLLFALLLPRGNRRRALVLLCVGVLAADAASWYRDRFHHPRLTVTFLSVGQGDCTLIEFPGSAVMIVDGGGLSTTFDVGERVVAPQLWRRKIAHIDQMVLTHADFDHFGGLTYLARAFRPDEFWWNGSAADGVSFTALREAFAERPSRIIRRGYRRVIGGVEVVALHPGRDDRGGRNDRSLTLRLRYGPTTILLPGDVEEAGELALIRHGRDQLASTILKVPHHGSRTSSSRPFLDAVRPRLAVVSAGHENRFGFPHPTVVHAYRERATRLLRTDVHGAVTLDITANGTVRIGTGGTSRPGLDFVSDDVKQAGR